MAEDRNSARVYVNSVARNCWFEKRRLRRYSNMQTCISNRVDDIHKRLNSYDKPLDPPPVPVYEDVVPCPSPAMFLNVASMQSGLAYHFTELQNFSGYFVELFFNGCFMIFLMTLY